MKAAIYYVYQQKVRKRMGQTYRPLRHSNNWSAFQLYNYSNLEFIYHWTNIGIIVQ